MFGKSKKLRLFLTGKQSSPPPGSPHLPDLASQTVFVRQRQAGKVSGMNTPNQLSREAIEEFKAIYQEEFGEVLSDDEVKEIAMRLLRFFGIMNKGK